MSSSVRKSEPEGEKASPVMVPGKGECWVTQAVREERYQSKKCGKERVTPAGRMIRERERRGKLGKETKGLM